MVAAEMLELSELANYLPRRRGKKVHVKTIKRWIIKGCRGVRLAGQKSGDIWYSTLAWLREFQDECTRRATPDGTRAPAAVSAASEQARGELQRRYGFHAKDESEVKVKRKVQDPGMRRKGANAAPV